MTPAILGGQRTVTEDVSDALRWPRFDRSDEESVLSLLRSPHFSSMQECMTLEAELRSWLGVPYSIAYCNATSAIFSALSAVGVRPGDEVIVPSATFWATALPALHLGAIPVFAEIDPDTLGLDPTDVVRRITKRTRAVIVVHLAGIPAKVRELRAICDDHSIALIEDVAHAHGAGVDGTPLGTIGDVGIFSFEATKQIPAGEGGALVTSNRSIWERALCFGHYERLTIEDTPYRKFAQTGFGFNFRMAPLSAALVRSQLRKLPQLQSAQRAAMEPIGVALEDLGFSSYCSTRYAGRVYHAFCAQYPTAKFKLSKRAFLAAITAEGVPAGISDYPLLHEQPIFREGHWRDLSRMGPDPSVHDPLLAGQELPVTERIRKHLFTLPVFTDATPSLIAQCIGAIRKVLAHEQIIAERFPE